MLPCRNTCDDFKIAACQNHCECDGPFLMPCGEPCFVYKEDWSKIRKVASANNWYIDKCKTCDRCRKDL